MGSLQGMGASAGPRNMLAVQSGHRAKPTAVSVCAFLCQQRI